MKPLPKGRPDFMAAPTRLVPDNNGPAPAVGGGYRVAHVVADTAEMRSAFDLWQLMAVGESVRDGR